MWCYHEPLHDHFGYLTPASLIELASNQAEVSRKLRHGNIDGHYFQEYEAASDRLLPLFEPSLSYDRFFPAEESVNSALKRYVSALLEYCPARPAMHFNRSFGRIAWLHRHFDALGIYLLRCPRNQWTSALSFDRTLEESCFSLYSIMIVGRNHSSKVLGPLIHTLHLPPLTVSSFVEVIGKCKQILATLDLEQQYRLFYYLWLVGLINGLAHCDLVIDMDRLSQAGPARDHAEREFLKWNINLDFSDCNLPSYHAFSLSSENMSMIEESVHVDLARCHSPRLFAKAFSRTDGRCGLIDGEHRRRMHALALHLTIPSNSDSA